jgi:hypothetical protein
VSRGQATGQPYLVKVLQGRYVEDEALHGYFVFDDARVVSVEAVEGLAAAQRRVREIVGSYDLQGWNGASDVSLPDGRRVEVAETTTHKLWLALPEYRQMRCNPHDTTAVLAAFNEAKAEEYAREATMPERRNTESELFRAASLVSEIGEWREEGVIDSSQGSSDDDLLGAVEDLEDAIRAWRADCRKANTPQKER